MNNKIKSILAVLVIISMIIPAMAVGNANSNKAQNVIGGVEIAPGVFYLGQSIDKEKVVDEYVFVHYAKDSDKVSKTKPVWDETYDKYKFLLPSRMVRWVSTMTYEVNPTVSGLDETQVSSALSASLTTWNSALVGTPAEFVLFNDLKLTTEGFNTGDTTNRITFDDLIEVFGANVIAVNYLRIDRVSYNIIESDVRFGTGFTWSVSGESDKMDLQNIATHEFGHNGLGDLYMPPSKALTMHGYSWYGDIGKRDLGTGDISGIQALYGE